MQKEKSEKNQSWRGYTLEELAHRRAINAVKQELTREQLSLVYSRLSGNTGSGPVSKSVESGLSRFMTYATYGAKAFSIVRKISGIFRQFRGK